MPPKKGTKSKKAPAPRVSEESVDGENLECMLQYSPEMIQCRLDDLRQEVESKCTQIQKESEFMITCMQEAFHLELIKLPTQVKKMSLKRFKEEFGDSLDAVTRGVISSKNPSNPSYVKSNDIYASGVKNSRSSVCFQTPKIPLQHGRGGLIEATPSTRNPREGETILSINGSPLGMFSTVVKAPKQTNQSFVPPTPGVFVPLDQSGELVNIESVDIASLTEESKQDAIAKMQAVMENMQAFMTKLQSNS